MKFYPILGAQAISQKKELKAADAFRVWTVAKTIDREGKGEVSIAALRARLQRIGRADSTISGMISQAIKRGWVDRHEWKAGYLSLRSPGKIALLTLTPLVNRVIPSIRSNSTPISISMGAPAALLTAR